MANIRPIKDKNGVVNSYQIRVYRGRDVDGKQLKPYSTVWKVPAGMSDELVSVKVRAYAEEYEKVTKHKTAAPLIEGTLYPAHLGGVYILIKSEEIVYVGESENLFKRVADHLRGKDNKKEFDSFMIFPCSFVQRKHGEQYLIDCYHPYYNKLNNDSYENRKGFRNQYRDYDVASLKPSFERVFTLFPSVKEVC